MQSRFRKTKLSNLAFLFTIFFCSAFYSFAQIRENQKFQSDDEEAFRAAIIKIENSPGAELAENFTYVSRCIDLNGDKHEEVVVWIPEDNMGGTSGYSILILSRTKNGYQKLLDIDQAWTPIIALKSKHTGWGDIAVQIGGGGVEWKYSIYHYNGRSYKYNRTQKEKPEGEILIEKNWNQTFFGPMP